MRPRDTKLVQGRIDVVIELFLRVVFPDRFDDCHDAQAQAHGCID